MSKLVVFYFSSFVMIDLICLFKCFVEFIVCLCCEVELYIEGGWVSVDGEVIEEL